MFATSALLNPREIYWKQVWIRAGLVKRFPDRSTDPCLMNNGEDLNMLVDLFTHSQAL